MARLMADGVLLSRLRALLHWVTEVELGPEVTPLGFPSPPPPPASCAATLCAADLLQVLLHQVTEVELRGQGEGRWALPHWDTSARNTSANACSKPNQTHTAAARGLLRADQLPLPKTLPNSILLPPSRA